MILQRWCVYAGVAAGLLLMGAQGCSKPPAPMGQMPTMVTTAPVTSADVPVYMDEIGKTSADELVNVVPQISGKIVARKFEDGADLHAGQILFQIDPRPFQALLDAANAAVAQATAQRDNAKTEYTRMASLLSTKAVAQQDYDNSKNALAVAEANVTAAVAQTETATLNLEYCTIKSPIDGRAGQRLIDVGNVVTANTSSLLVVQKLTPIYVDFTIAENDLDRVRQNMANGTLKVYASTPDDADKKPAEGSLTFLDNAVQDGTGTIKLRATVDNKDRRFWPGQFVQVQLVLATLHNAVMVPNEAIQIGQDGPYVFVLKADSTADQVIVIPGQRQGSETVIAKGLSPGQTVIAAGQLMVQPGSVVTVVPPSGAGPGGPPAGAHG